MKVPDIKEQLRQHALPVSGKTADLAARLAQADPSLAASLAKGHTAHKCTEEGARLVSEFLDAARESRTIMEKSVIALLARSDFREAVVTLASFEAAQVFPRGMGVDWAHYDPARDELILRLIFTRIPRALAQAPREYLPACRVAAGMLHLVWNVGQASTWLCSSIPAVAEEALFKIASDLHSHALFLAEIDSLKASPFLHHLRVLTRNDHLVCESCKRLAEGTHTLEDHPEIPNPDCSSPWCRCSIAAGLS
jgi:hypothetical protein